MGQKTNPIGNRLGIIKGWDSSWFGGKEFAQKVVEDEQIRVYLNARIQKGGISKIVIERTLKRVTVTLHTSRPGIIIGKGGQEVDRIKEELKKLTGKDVQINIIEIRKPEIDAAIVGETIAKQIESRINYKRAIKMSIQSAMRAGAEGIKVRVSGRLNGAEMAQSLLESLPMVRPKEMEVVNMQTGIFMKVVGKIMLRMGKAPCILQKAMFIPRFGIMVFQNKNLILIPNLP